MYGSIRDFMADRGLAANQPDFNRMKIRGGESPYRQPVMPGEQRLLPEMQEKMRPALPPVRKAADDFLTEYLTARGGGSESVVADNPSSSAERKSYEDAIRGLLDQQRLFEERSRMREVDSGMLEYDVMGGGFRRVPSYRSVPVPPSNTEPFANETPEFRALLKRLGVIE